MDAILCGTPHKNAGDVARLCRLAIILSHQNSNDEDHITTTRWKILRHIALLLHGETAKTGSAMMTDFGTASTLSSDMNAMDYMRIYSSHQLQEAVPFNTVYCVPGSSSEEAVDRLHNHLVVPLGRSNSLHRLLKGRGLSSLQHCHQQRRPTIVTGVLLMGPPGCGKTLLARHAAVNLVGPSEGNSRSAGNIPSLRLLDVSCPSLLSRNLGGSERNIVGLFRAARAAAPCILLLEGIEAIAGVRGQDDTTEGTMDRVLSTLLMEMDGMGGSNEDENAVDDKDDNGVIRKERQQQGEGIAVIATTRFCETNIDSALLRSGRLGQVIHVGLPDLETRTAIAERELKGRALGEEDELREMEEKEENMKSESSLNTQTRTKLQREYAELVGQKTEGRSGSEVVGLVREAAVISIREWLENQEENRKMKNMRKEQECQQELLPSLQWKHLLMAAEFLL